MRALNPGLVGSAQAGRYPRSRRLAYGVVGALLQLLKGGLPAQSIPALEIGLDRRHRELIMLTRTEFNTASFHDWTMGFVDVRGFAQLLFPGLRATGAC